MSNRRRPTRTLCGYCRERSAEHQVNAPEGGYLYACAECWPLLRAIVSSWPGATLLPCSCGCES